MEKLHHPLGRGISYLLIYLTAIQPLHPAFAAGINPANTTTQVQAGNVPVVNIATPNSAGISHNTYKDFNVGASGAVLNNSTVAGKSQLAGQVNANSNLKGNAASLIINEVTGGTRSELNGKLEVFGAKANVMIANPNGITCDGGGFINTPGVTLTTGKPQFDKQGALDALEVKKGSIIIGGKGLDANAQDYVDIISRATELNGKITAQNLSLTQGTNRASYKDGTLTAIAGEGAQPQLAVDTKALGGMYANKIRLVANEEGVGVNLANLTSTQQGITLDTKGKIQLGNTAAKTDLNITAKQTDIIKGATVKSERDITVASTTLNNNGTLSAGKDMRLFNDNLTNTQATIQANNNLWIQKDAVGNKGAKVENRSGTIKTTTGDLVIRTKQLSNVRDSFVIQEKEIIPTTSPIDPNVGVKIIFYDVTGPIPRLIYYYADFDSSVPKTWFEYVDLYKDNSLHTAKKERALLRETNSSNIYSGGDVYISSTSIHNSLSSINADKNVFMTGGELKNESLAITEEDVFSYVKLNQEKPFDSFLSAENINFLQKKPGLFLGKQPIKYTLAEQKTGLTINKYALGSITAGMNLVADFKDTITSKISLPNDKGNLRQVVAKDTMQNVFSAENVLLHAKKIGIEGNIDAKNNLTLIAEGSANIRLGKISAKNTLSVIAAKNIDVGQSVILAKDISLSAREGNVHFYSDSRVGYYSPDGLRAFSQLNASDSLSLQAGKDIEITGVSFGKNNNTTLTAGNNLLFKNDDAFLKLERLGINSTDDLPPVLDTTIS